MSDPELDTDQDCAEECKRMLQTSIQRRDELDRAYAAVRDLAVIGEQGTFPNLTASLLNKHAETIKKARERK